jgi:phosphatidylethanolamine/phosphatidyl-N-methylethanolamine N-methyltransferase
VTLFVNGSGRTRRNGVRRPALANPLPFLGGWSRNPVGVGWPFASSYWTARRLAEAALVVAVPEAGPILELGAGTGPVTEALIDLGCPVDRLVVVERDAELCRWLNGRFAGLRVLQGDGLDMAEMLASAHLSSVGVVLSGLPMRAIHPAAAARCYTDAFQRMPASGAVIQYTYGFRPPVDPDYAGLGLQATFVGREWRNVPPMGIWCYRQRGRDASSASART